MNYLNLQEGSASWSINLKPYAESVYFDGKLSLYLPGNNSGDGAPDLIIHIDNVEKANCSQELHFHCQAIQKFVTAVKAKNHI